MRFLLIIQGGCNTLDFKEQNNHLENKTLSFNPVEVHPGSDYDISLEMNDQELFTVDASITVRMLQ